MEVGSRAPWQREDVKAKTSALLGRELKWEGAPAGFGLVRTRPWLAFARLEVWLGNTGY